MKTIAVVNQKGGVGKTTLATNLARAIQRAGRTVVLVDSDPQGSARDWAAVNEDQPVLTVGIDRPTIGRDLAKMKPHGDVAVIDGAPQVAELSASAIAAADLVLIPVQPSPYDIWATADLVELVRERRAIADGRPAAAFIVSRAIVGTSISGDVREALEGYGLPTLATTIHQRVAYAKTAAVGSTVVDDRSDATAAVEIDRLCAEVLRILDAGTMGAGE